jgi:hypothetical protein
MQACHKIKDLTGLHLMYPAALGFVAMAVFFLLLWGLLQLGGH